MARNSASHDGRSRKLRMETLERREMLAGDLELVKDINALPKRDGSDPSEIVDVSGMAFFKATTESEGYGLWRSDGAEGGTTFLKSLGPPDRYRSHGLTNVNGTLFFVNRNGSHGHELWSSDGTVGGTLLVKGIGQGDASLSPSCFTNVGGTLYFVASDGSSGAELWKSDGSAAGTVLIKDILPGAGSSFPRNLVKVGETLYFTAEEPTTGRELWQSDGSTSGTVLVKDLETGRQSSVPHSLVDVNGQLFFLARTGAGSLNRLWKSDGTSAGTQIVSSLLESSGAGSSSSFRELTSVAGQLYFAFDDSRNRGLWKSDGTEAGTVRINNEAGTLSGAIVRYLANVSGSLYFGATVTSGGNNLWRTDGSAAGTVLISSKTAERTVVFPRYLTNVSGTLYFRVDDFSNRAGIKRDLWKVEATEIGAELVKEVGLGARAPGPMGVIANVGGTLFFRGNDGLTGYELWKSNGTNSGTVRVKDINGGTADASLYGFIKLKDAHYFTAVDGVNGRAIWKTDGTESGTQLVKSFALGSQFVVPLMFTVVGDWLYFGVYQGNQANLQLWKSDGTTAGTVLVKDGFLNTLFSQIPTLQEVNGLLYLAGYSPGIGYSLWKSDGTETGTVLVKALLTRSTGTSGTGGSVTGEDFGGGSPAPSFYLANVNGTLYFNAIDGTAGEELWKTDGTESGTVRVKDLLPGVNSSRPVSLINVAGQLYFSAQDHTGFGLWKSDGTAAGTVKVKGFGFGNFPPRFFANAGTTLFFQANDGATGYEFWKSDGTETGTTILRDINPGLSSSSPFVATVIGDLVYFRANDGVHGQELWKSDGTPEGTVMVGDFNPGPGSGGAYSAISVRGTLYFTSSIATSSWQLWKLQPEPAGDLLTAVHKGTAEDLYPQIYGVIGDKLIIKVETIAYGEELWRLNLTPPPAGDYNRDGLVTTADNLFWHEHFGATTGVGLQADGNDDGVVDSADYTIWRNAFDNRPAIAASPPRRTPFAPPTSPVATVALASAATSAAPIAASPARRDLLTLAARDAAFAELGADTDDSRGATLRGVQPKTSTPRSVAPRLLGSAIGWR